VLGSVSMAQSKVETGGCHDPKGKYHRNQIEMCTALLQVLADSLRIWYTARRDTLFFGDIHATVIAGDSP